MMIKRLAVVMLAICLCQAAGQAALNATGDVTPTDPATWTSTTNVYIGDTGVGSLTVDNGSDLLSRYSYVAYSAGSTGAATVDGVGSTWTAEFPNIGYFGDGTLDITGGGAVNSSKAAIGSGGTGVVTVSGSGSIWANSGRLLLPHSGNGTLNITDGGTVVVGDTTYLGLMPSAAGTINLDNGTFTTAGFIGSLDDLMGTGTINANGLVTDTDLVFDATEGLTKTLTLNGPGQNIALNLDVNGSGTIGAGYRGNGSMHVADGVTVQSSSGFVAFKTGSSGVVTVAGTGSAWTSPGAIAIGWWGDGTLDITDGGTVSSDGAYVGWNDTSTATVTVSGPGSTWDAGSLRIAHSGDATLNITAGGTVTSTSGMFAAGSGAGGVGVVNVSGAGSNWTLSSQLTVAYRGTATVNISSGGAVTSRLAWLGHEEGSTGVVTVDGAGSILDCTSLILGSHNTASSATLELTDGGKVDAGSATLYAGTTFGIGLSGVEAESRLKVTDRASLGGELNVSLLGSPQFVPGDDFVIIDAGSLSGTFDTVILPTDQDWIVDYDTVAGDVIVGIVAGLGNFNGDTDIDGDDIDLLADAIRLGSTDFALFDISADGTSNGSDSVIDTNDLDYLIHQLVETPLGFGSEYGDFNLDGVIDTTDLTRLATNFGAGSTWAEGNANRRLDLVIDTTDLTILGTYFGFTATDAIPEPMTLGLMAGGAIGLLRRRTSNIRRDGRA